MKEAGRECSRRPGESSRREIRELDVVEEAVHEVKDGKEENGEEKGQDYLSVKGLAREQSPRPGDPPRREPREVDVTDEKDDERETGEERGRDNCAQEASGRRERSPRPWDQKTEDREDSFIALAANDEFRAKKEEGWGTEKEGGTI